MRDFLVDEITGDITFVNGDLAFGDSTKQNQKAILLANKNDYKESPMLGVELEMALDDEDTNDLFRTIRMEMVMDGMTVNDLKIMENGTIGLDAIYK